MKLSRQEIKQAMILAHTIRKEAAIKWGCRPGDIIFSMCLQQSFNIIKIRKRTSIVKPKPKKNYIPSLYLTVACIILITILGVNTKIDRYYNSFVAAIVENERLLEIVNLHEREVRATENFYKKEIGFLYNQIGNLEEMLSCKIYTYQAAINNLGISMKIDTPSNFSAEEFERAWQVLGAKGMYGTGELLVQAEKETGINSLVLGALAYHESNGGTSKIAVEKNNLFGWGAYDSDPYYYARTFATRGEGVRYVAEEVKDKYADRGLNTLVKMNRKYASDPKWSIKINAIMRKIAMAAIEDPQRMLEYEMITNIKED